MIQIMLGTRLLTLTALSAPPSRSPRYGGESRGPEEMHEETYNGNCPPRHGRTNKTVGTGGLPDFIIN
jgi:hypothetical protein